MSTNQNSKTPQAIKNVDTFVSFLNASSCLVFACIFVLMLLVVFEFPNANTIIENINTVLVIILCATIIFANNAFKKRNHWAWLYFLVLSSLNILSGIYFFYQLATGSYDPQVMLPEVSPSQLPTLLVDFPILQYAWSPILGKLIYLTLFLLFMKDLLKKEVRDLFNESLILNT